MADKDCECFGCKHGMGALVEREAQNMEEDGWYAHYVTDDPVPPFGVNAHTHGFEETFSHPDVQICFPLDTKVIHSIFWRITDFLKEGNRLESGKSYPGLIGNEMEVAFLWATEDDRNVLRAILPDSSGCIDREDMKEPFGLQFEGTF